MSEIVNPFGSQEQNTCREFITYDGHGTVERVQYIDEDLARFIQIVEYATCGKIDYGIRNPSTLQNKSFPPLEITPRLIRTRTRRKPAPEARSWVYFFLKHHPDVQYGYKRIAELYGYNYTSIRQVLMELEFAIARECNTPLHEALRSVADALAAAGYQAVDIRSFGRAA